MEMMVGPIAKMTVSSTARLSLKKKQPYLSLSPTDPAAERRRISRSRRTIDVCLTGRDMLLAFRKLWVTYVDLYGGMAEYGCPGIHARATTGDAPELNKSHEIYAFAPGVTFRHVVQDEQRRNGNSGPYHQRYLRDVSPVDELRIFQPILRIVGDHESNSTEAVWHHAGRNPYKQRMRNGEKDNQGHPSTRNISV